VKRAPYAALFTAFSGRSVSSRAGMVTLHVQGPRRFCSEALCELQDAVEDWSL
jgi:hypothetical protein